MLINQIVYCPGATKTDGALCVAEANSGIVPFEIRRVYYSYGAEEGTIRGYHAHKELEQILICVYGKIEVVLDNGKGKVETGILERPTQGLYVGPCMWRTMKWLQSGSVLLVLASQHYDTSDYIRNYEDFILWITKKEL